jgi:hypothetical protein
MMKGRRILGGMQLARKEEAQRCVGRQCGEALGFVSDRGSGRKMIFWGRGMKRGGGEEREKVEGEDLKRFRACGTWIEQE